MIHPGFLIILFLALLIASYRDLQIREVPDTLNYGLITLGLLGGLIIAIVESNPLIFFQHLAGFLAGFVIGIGMYYSRQWGGGDAKLIMGIGAIVGFWPGSYILFIFVALLFLSGAFYGMAYLAYLALKNSKKFKKAFTKKLREEKIHRTRQALVCTGILILIIVFFVDWDAKVLLLSFLLSLYLLVYSFIAIKIVEEQVMVKTYPVGKLTEGDWVVETVKIGKKIIVNKKTPGITKKQISALKKCKIKTVRVKEGVPFVPAFLIAYLLLLLLIYKNVGFLF